MFVYSVKNIFVKECAEVKQYEHLLMRFLIKMSNGKSKIAFFITFKIIAVNSLRYYVVVSNRCDIQFFDKTFERLRKC